MCAASMHTEVNVSSGISHTGLGATAGLGVAILYIDKIGILCIHCMSKMYSSLSPSAVLLASLAICCKKIFLGYSCLMMYKYILHAHQGDLCFN